MAKYVKLEDFGLDNYTKIVLKNYDRYFIYYKLNEGEDYGFKFKVINNREVAVADSICLLIFEGTAFYDGIVHLYMGSEFTNNLGYLCYPDTNIMIAILEELKNLEDEFCRQKIKEKNNQLTY